MAAGAAVTTVGKGLIATAMVAAHTARYIAHGTGTTTPTVAQTALVAAADLSAGKAVIATSEAVQASVKYRIVKAIAATVATEDITEVALFDSDVMTNMLYREVFAPVTLLITDTITYTVDITVG